jgi:ClpA/ClpB-like protein
LAMASVPPGLPPNHEADDLEIMWEAFQIAGWNSRWSAMDALLDAGLPVDYSPPIGWPLMLEAAGNMHLDLAEYLVRRGADLDREWPPHGSARGFARMHFGNWPQKEHARRLLEICNAGNPDEILAELDAKRPSPPPLYSRASRMLQLAADDAARQQQSVVTTENMLVALLRLEGGQFASIFMGSGADMQKLRAMIGARLLPDSDPLSGQDLPRDADAEAAVQLAIAETDARRREQVDILAVLVGMLSRRDGAASRMLTDVGMNLTATRERLLSGL